MGSVTLAAIVFAVVFAGGAIGLQLQRAAPESYTSGGARDMTGAVVGLVTLLLALVLGLLIWTAYGVFSTQKTLIQTVAVNALKFDRALQEYGPRGDEGRKLLKSGLRSTISYIWKDSDDVNFVVRNYTQALDTLKNRVAYLATLEPTSDAEKAAKVDATEAANAISQARIQMALGLEDPISYPLVCIVIAWAAFLFCGYGLLSQRHPMSYVVLAVGAMAIASAIYVVVELIDPYTGLIKISPAPIIDVLRAVDDAAAPAGGRR